jgi:hypothetical protein
MYGVFVGVSPPLFVCVYFSPPLCMCMSRTQDKDPNISTVLIVSIACMVCIPYVLNVCVSPALQGKDPNISTALKQDSITRGVKYSMATGNWGVGKAAAAGQV